MVLGSAGAHIRRASGSTLVLLLALWGVSDATAAEPSATVGLSPEEAQLQAFYGLSFGVNVTTQDGPSGPTLRSAFNGDNLVELQPNISAVCDAAFAGNLEQLANDMQINITEDPTLTYLNLMLPLQLATASLCRQLLITGFDAELLQICFTQVPTLDGGSANLLLELESRGYVPADFACSVVPGERCQPQNLGCGACSDNSTQQLLATLEPLLDLELCSPEEPRNINSDFACIYSTVLMVQANLSRAYLALALPSSSVNFIATDIVELYKDNAIHSWIADRELDCPGLVPHAQ